MKLNCVIVDDSSIQRIVIAKLVNNHPQLHLVGEFTNAFDAKIFLNNQKIDLIFLDVEMPVVSGFDFLDGLKNKPQIIFVTSKADYALRAFDYNATDYLQKPIQLERFNVAIKKALELCNFLKEQKNETESDFIFIKSNLKNLKIYISKIKWIEALGDYVKIVCEDESNVVLSTMKDFQEDLPENFVRVHKSFIVNTHKIDRFNSKFAEIGDIKIPLSRNKKDILSKIII